ncbi:hypothetical protein BDP27DRAFT_1311956, partial [Rhodocollybia butyracea]
QIMALNITTLANFVPHLILASCVPYREEYSKLHVVYWSTSSLTSSFLRSTLESLQAWKGFEKLLVTSHRRRHCPLCSILSLLARYYAANKEIYL